MRVFRIPVAGVVLAIGLASAMAAPVVVQSKNGSLFNPYTRGTSSLLLGDGTTADVPTVVNIEGGASYAGGDGERGTYYQAECPVEPPPPPGTVVCIR